MAAPPMYHRRPRMPGLAMVPVHADLEDNDRRTAAPEKDTMATSSAEWDAFVQDYIDRTFAAQPHWGVFEGRHEFDGRLPDWSRDGLAAESARLAAERERAESFSPDGLDARQGFERDYLIAMIDGELFWRTTMEQPFTHPNFYAWALAPDVYVSRDYAPLEVRLRAYVRYAREVPAAAGHIRANLATPMPRTFVGLARTVFGGLADYYATDVVTAYEAVEDAALQSEFRAANDAAVTAMRALDAWFESLEADATDAFAMGAERFAEMLQATERVDVGLDALEAAGRADLERNLAALAEACAAYAPGESIPACLARAHAEKPVEGPVAAAARQLTELKAFVVAEGLVSIPGTEEARVGESPPHMRWNAAYIDIPGPYEDDLPSTYYIAPPDPSWSESDRNAYVPAAGDLLYISAHEVWPGHFLQFLHAHRVRSAIGRVFGTYAFAEGWAHYAEELMAEAGFAAGDAGARIGQLRNALLRNVRFLSAIGLHTGRMTVADSERMFREKAFQDPGNARQQAARGTFDPAYLNYTMGKLMIRKLREDWTASRGGRAAWREFHDTFLGFGSPPIPLVRRAMMGEDDDGSLF